MADALHRAVEKIADGHASGLIIDSAGSTIGRFDVTLDPDSANGTNVVPFHPL